MLSKLIGSKVTLGREVAALSFLLYAYAVLEGETEIVKVIVWPTFSYIAAVVGIRMYGGQSSESTDR